MRVVLQGSVSAVERWISKSALAPGSAATYFVHVQSFHAAQGLVKAVDPLVHFCTAVVAKAAAAADTPSLGVLHLQLPSVCGSGWMGATGSSGADVAWGLGSRVRDWLVQSDLAAV